MELSPRTYPPLQGRFLSTGSHGLVFRGREGSHIVSPQKSRLQPDVEEYKWYNFFTRGWNDVTTQVVKYPSI